MHAALSDGIARFHPVEESWNSFDIQLSQKTNQKTVGRIILHVFMTSAANQLIEESGGCAG